MSETPQERRSRLNEEFGKAVSQWSLGGGSLPEAKYHTVITPGGNVYKHYDSFEDYLNG
jgi:hypothetical protein